MELRALLAEIIGGLRKGITRINRARTIESLAFAIQVFMDKRVLDRTGLQGVYELDFEFDYGALRGLEAAGAAADANAGFNILHRRSGAARPEARAAA